MMGFTFNGIHSNTYGIVAKSIDRSLLPALRRREMLIPGKNGTYDFFGNTFDNRIISVELSYRGTSLNDLRVNARAIAYWLSGYSADKTLIFDDEPDKVYTARIFDAIGLQNLFLVGQATIEFQCEPFARSAFDAYDIYYDMGYYYDEGWGYANDEDDDGICNFSWTSSNYTFSQYSMGTFKAPIIITINGAVTNPSISSTSGSFTISATLTAGSSLLINTENYTVTLNGSNYLHKFTGDFINFLPGDNIMTFSGSGTINATVTLTWSQNWI